MSSLLKGNFKTKKQVNVADSQADKVKATENKDLDFKTAALNSIGGSMVYVERTPLEWNGDEETK